MQLETAQELLKTDVKNLRGQFNRKLSGMAEEPHAEVTSALTSGSFNKLSPF